MGVLGRADLASLGVDARSENFVAPKGNMPNWKSTIDNLDLSSIRKYKL